MKGRGRGGIKTFLIVALLIIITVSLVYLSKQDGLREGYEGKKKSKENMTKREAFRMREALDAGCYSSDGKYLGTGKGIIDCQKNYPEKNATYKSR